MGVKVPDSIFKAGYRETVVLDNYMAMWEYDIDLDEIYVEAILVGDICLYHDLSEDAIAKVEATLRAEIEQEKFNFEQDAAIEIWEQRQEQRAEKWCF